MRTVNAKKGSVLPIGRLGENEATAVLFDVSCWIEQFGVGTFSLLAQRNGDTAPYPCIVEHDGNTVKWEVKSADVAQVGYGKCELIYTVGDTIAKSEIYTTVTGNALTGGGDVPEPWEDWVQRIIEAASTIEQNIGIAVESAENAAQSAEEAAEILAEITDMQLQEQIDAINEKIPEQASADNQLADKDFVNSSVATNTANYISNENNEPFTSLEELQAYSGTLTNNDYAFVVGTDAQGNVTYTRYKYNASTQEWAEEYVLNNSSFTSEQWSAINSGITALGVEQIEDNRVAIVGLLADMALKANDADVYHEWQLAFDGTKISKDGVQQNFTQIATAIDDKTKFVYIVYLNRLYIPQYRDSSLVSFSCSYLDGTTPTIRRIRMTSAGAITTATETFYNKNEIDAKETELKETLNGKQDIASMPTAVKNAVASTTDPAWTPKEQAAARARMGLPGDFELIEDITLSENSRMLARDAEPDGTPYSFRKIFVEIIVPAVSATPYANLLLAESYVGSHQVLRNWVNVAAGRHGYGYVLIDDDCGLKSTSIGSYGYTTNWGVLNNTQMFKSAPTFYPGLYDKFVIDTFTDNAPFFAGTKFRIYAVRA